MKEIFDDDSYIELTKEKDDKILLSLAARDQNNSDMITMISVEIDKDKLLEMINKLFKTTDKS